MPDDKEKTDDRKRRTVVMDDGTAVDVSGDISDEAVKRWYAQQVAGEPDADD